MALQQADVDHIISQIKPQLSFWMTELGMEKSSQLYESEWRERTIRLEEALKHQRELMQQGFAQTDKHFEQIRDDMNKRFEQVDRRFEQFDKRFEQMRGDMDKRFEQMRGDMDKRFEQMYNAMNERFEQVDKRFEQVDKRFEQMDKRFEQVDKRFDMMTRRMDRFMIWSFGITLSSAGAVVAVLKLWH